MYIVEKINRTRKVLRELLEDEWDISVINSLSPKELEIMYENANTNIHESTGCNITLSNKKIPDHKLHILYYNFPELNRGGTKINKTCCDKLTALYKENDDDEDGLFEKDDSILAIIMEPISETIEKGVEDTFLQNQELIRTHGLREPIEVGRVKAGLTIGYFRNIHMFHIDRLTVNLTKHALVPKHIKINTEKAQQKLLDKLNVTKNMMPVILRTDAIAKYIRICPGDICEIHRGSQQTGNSNYYRVCK
jgi:DNA-directed RNA polymerase subunit H (RpoH/RPB5)|tara:strand:+ start:484 stop:1233 length:750 start_codon:yes stop_codon:yes gene_type:complete